MYLYFVVLVDIEFFSLTFLSSPLQQRKGEEFFYKKNVYKTPNLYEKDNNIRFYNYIKFSNLVLSYLCLTKCA